VPSLAPVRIHIESGFDLGDDGIFRGNLGLLSGLPAPSPLNTAIYPVRNAGEWTLTVDAQLGITASYAIDVTIYT